MKRRFFLLLGLIFSIILVGSAWRWSQRVNHAPVVINGTAVPPLPPLNADKVTQGATLYAQHCARCHGVDLKAVADWKKPLVDGSFPPPPQDDSGHTWHHSDALLMEIVTNGGDAAYNSKMPAFNTQLTADDIRAVLAFIKSHWNHEHREFQWWMTATRDH